MSPHINLSATKNFGCSTSTGPSVSFSNHFLLTGQQIVVLHSTCEWCPGLCNTAVLLVSIPSRSPHWSFQAFRTSLKFPHSLKKMTSWCINSSKSWHKVDLSLSTLNLKNCLYPHPSFSPSFPPLNMGHLFYSCSILPLKCKKAPLLWHSATWIISSLF